MKDTPPEINAILFHAMMAKTPGERCAMGFDMMATARALVWSSIPEEWDHDRRRRAFCERFYGWDVIAEIEAARAGGSSPKV